MQSTLTTEELDKILKVTAAFSFCDFSFLFSFLVASTYQVRHIYQVYDEF